MKGFKRIVLAIICITAVFSASLYASAEQINTVDSFTHQDTAGGSQITVSMPDVYSVEAVIDSRSLNLEEAYGTISDIACGEDGSCYILTEDGIIVEFDDNFNFKKYHKLMTEKGEIVDVSGARGVYVYGEELYIADTLNSRVLCTVDGIIKKEILVPESDLIPSDFVFSPSKVAKDSKGYLYVISEGSYYGALMYDPEDSFLGFYGANTVKGNVLTTLSYIWDTLTQNDIKRAKKVKTLPYQFVDICIDDNDFVYTCTGLTSESNATGQIRMLSPGGTNILYRRQYNGVRVDSGSFKFGETDYAKRLNKKINQDFECVQVDENGFIYALDITYGLIYVYDTDCNLLTAFGGGRGEGTQNGIFKSAVSMAVSGERVFVADALENNVQVFKITDFGRNLLLAQRKVLDAKYTESKNLWEEVLKFDSQNQLALRAMAKIAYINGDYEASLNYSKEGMDYVIYGQALKKTQADFIENNFVWMFIAAILLIALTVFALILLKKKNIKIKNPKIKVMFNCLLHPFDSFNAIRYGNQGSTKIAVVLTLLFFVSNVLAVLESNFRYTTFDANTFSSLFVIAQTVGLIIGWSIANWGTSVLLQGIGKLKHVFIVTAYSVLPIIVYNLISIPLSYLITSPSSVFLSGLKLVAMICTGIILSVGLMVVHNFSFPRYFISVVVSLCFLFLIVFILFVFGILLSQLGGFLGTVFMEVVYR